MPIRDSNGNLITRNNFYNVKTEQAPIVHKKTKYKYKSKKDTPGAIWWNKLSNKERRERSRVFLDTEEGKIYSELKRDSALALKHYLRETNPIKKEKLRIEYTNIITSINIYKA